MRRLALALSVLAVALGATACTGGSSSDTTGAPAASRQVTRSPSPPPVFSGVRHRLPKGKQLDNDADLYRLVSLDRCRPVQGGWAAGGVVNNASNRRASLRILVFFNDAQARSIDSAATTLTVPAGQTRRWSAERHFHAPAHSGCVVRAVRAAS